MTKRKSQAAEKKLELISFPERERTKLEVRLEKSKLDLVETFCELQAVEQMTAHEGLSARVYIAFTSVLMDALHLAQEEIEERGYHHAMDR